MTKIGTVSGAVDGEGGNAVVEELYWQAKTV
jgi:hypothetical protein